MIGRIVSHFQILEKLGQGGMGVVYRALDTNLNREVALKILPPECMADTERKKRFIQEAQSASALNHPSIVIIHEIGSATDLDFIAMELVRGRVLAEIIGERRLEPPRVLKYAIRIADALGKAHERGIIHRDLKPQNIMITNEDEVKLLDFGLAKLVQPETGDPSDLATSPQMTQPGMVMGTPNYMSPEQAEGKSVDARSDIFSFGCVLYEMTTGHCPFVGASPAGVLGSILRDHPRPPDDRNSLSQGLWHVCGKALEKDREYRYQGMQDVLTDLKKLQRDLLSTAVASSPVVSRRRFGVAFFLLFMILLTAVGGFLWRWKFREKETPQQSRLSLISTFSGSHHAASFSPDASLVAFVDSSFGRTRVMVKNLTQGDAIEITSDGRAADRPRWSPKNDQIVFCTGSSMAHRESESIWSVPPLGGIPREIIRNGRNPNWSWDGTAVIFERGEEIWAADADGARQRKIEGIPKVPLLIADRFPAFAPDGKRIAFFQSESGPRGDYWISTVEGGQLRRLTSDLCAGGATIWTPDGTSIIFPSARAGSLTLWKMPVTGGAPQPLTTGAGADTDPELSRDGKRLVFTNTRNTYSLQVLNPATHKSLELVQTNGNMVAPQFSPDGLRIAYFSEPDLFVVDVRNPRPVRVTSGKGQDSEFPRWSSDGTSLYFYQTMPVRAFRKLSLEGGERTDVVPGWAWEMEYGAQPDPSGKLIAYARRSRGAISATLIRNLITGDEKALPRALDDPRWSRDGRWIAGYDAQNEIYVCGAHDGTCYKVTAGINPVWSADDAQLFFQRKGILEDGAELWSTDLTGKDQEKIFDLRPMLPIELFYDVSVKNDIVWVQFQPGNGQLWLLDFTPS